VQNAFSLLDQKSAGVLDLCRDSGIAYVPYFPLGSALPNMPKVTENTAVQAVAERVGATPAQVGLAWLLPHSDNVLLIRARRASPTWRKTLRVADIDLSEDDIAELENGIE
jgi:diketogulonate reductase-like aldo/keto reductase